LLIKDECSNPGKFIFIEKTAKEEINSVHLTSLVIFALEEFVFSGMLFNSSLHSLVHYAQQKAQAIKNSLNSNIE
jgi:hypothetical protein